MNRKVIGIILASLLAAVLVGCADTPIQPTDELPKETAAPAQTPLGETAPPAEASSEVTVPSTEEPPEVTEPATEEPTASPTQEPQPTPTPTPAPTQTPQPTPAPTPTPAPAVSQPAANAASYPTAPGTAVEKNDSAVIDYSNTKDGYVMVKWTGEAVKVAVQVTGPSNPETYTYYPRTDGNYDVLPLSDGNGTYKIVVCKNISGTQYAKVLAANISVKLGDSLAPFLRPNKFVNYTAGSGAVKKAQELVQGASDNLSRVKAVYNWVVTNLSYDYDKAKTVQSGYVPDLDHIMQVKKGICYDYAALMAAMLRSQGVPVKMIFGYTTTGEYHAWINVWSEETGWMDSVIYFDGKSWKLMDPTFASTGKQSSSIMEFIGNTANYKERFTY